MKSRSKAGQIRPTIQARPPDCLERVLETCAHLPSINREPAALHEYLAASASKIFQAAVTGMLLREDENYTALAIASGTDENVSKNALMAHARSFATQALEQERQINFRFSYRVPEGETVYHGLAHPLLTLHMPMVLLIVRSAAFSAMEVAAFEMLGNISCMALENSELTVLNSTQKNDLEKLLEISAELGNTSRLESFFPRFAVRGADFLGFNRAFIALVENGECYLRWGANKGVPSRLEIDISAVGSRVLEAKESQVCEDITQLPAIERTQLSRWESGLKQYLGVPLLTAEGRPLGVLGLLDKKNKSRISPEDVRRARVLGAEITVALEAAHNLQLSDQHRKRTEDLMEMALDLGSALRLPDFVKNFTERVAGMIGAKSAVLALAQGNKVECVGFFGSRPERELQRKLNAAFSEYAERHRDLRITSSGVQALGNELASDCG